MHYGQGALAGLVRSLMAQVGLRGPVASAMFTVLRLTNDQILENATGVGAPPHPADRASRPARTAGKSNSRTAVAIRLSVPRRTRVSVVLSR
jgi:hypothetical protein